MVAAIAEVESVEAFQEIASSNDHVLAFFSVKGSEPCSLMEQAVNELILEHGWLKPVKVEAQSVPTMTNQLEVKSAPTIIFLSKGNVVDRVEGFQPGLLFEKTEGLMPKDLQSRLQQLTTSSRVMLFMKGSPEVPRCGFSSRVVDCLRKEGVNFGYFDILTDQEVRQGLKEFSDWPTYPQLYVAGDFMGGCDIILQMAETGELSAALREAGGEVEPKAGGEETLTQRIEALLQGSPTLVLMKGSPDAPRCGFSRKVVEALRSNSIPFSHFDILLDEDIRQGVKKYSDWPTYPQLYVKGELLGGCDIICEMATTGELKQAVAAAQQ